MTIAAMEHNPNCAICNAPAFPECPCESERLTIAVRQAEQRAMDARLTEIRDWVISHARAHILDSFNKMTAVRKQQHANYLASLPCYTLYLQYAGHPPLHPHQLATLQSQIHDAQVDLKRGIDADWRASVMRYPEILDYFYSLVQVKVPSERDPAVAHPPFGTSPAGGATNLGTDKMRRRSRREDDERTVQPERPKARRRDSGIGRPKAPPVAPLPPTLPMTAYPSFYNY